MLVGSQVSVWKGTFFLMLQQMPRLPFLEIYFHSSLSFSLKCVPYIYLYERAVLY